MKYFQGNRNVNCPPELQTRIKTHAFANLDMLRGLAAFAVLLGHIDKTGRPLLSGVFAVDLFFVMSGFVITHAYEQRLLRGLRINSFILIRIIRLYPLYIFGGIIGLLNLWLLSPDADSSPVLVSFCTLLMVPTPSAVKIDLLFPANAVAWSLFFEVAVNFIYVVTWRYWTTKNLIVWCFATFFVLIAARIQLLSFDVGWNWGNIIGGAARISYSFPMGVLIYRLWQSGYLRVKIPFFVIFIATIFMLVPISKWNLTGQLRFVGYIMEVFFIGFLGPIIILSALSSASSAILRNVFLNIGGLSYALYALHGPLLTIFSSLIFFDSWTELSKILAILVVCILADLFYDQPARRSLNLRLKPFLKIRTKSLEN